MWIAGKREAYKREQDEIRNARESAKVLQSIMKDLPEEIATKVREHPYTIELEKKSGLPLTSIEGKSRYSKEAALEAAGKGQSLGELTLEQTEILAGLRSKEGKESKSHVKEALEALAKNKSLPGLTRDETKKVAGVYLHI